ncbi:MAG: GTPase ObgE [Synergistaceae bacterium]|jgi:GTP-binding protein|nr:GTPase ObgE [Synergistaceae bacterium]
MATEGSGKWGPSFLYFGVLSEVFNHLVVMRLRFVDLARIAIKAGRGGNGSLSFRREKYLPKGGPDGADGGKGGDVVLEAVGGVVTLADFEYNKRFQAGHAGHGKGAMQMGHNGEDLIIQLPQGTLVRDAETEELMADLLEPGQRFVAAKGGRGGRGNAHFTSSVRRAPRFAEKGDAGEEKTLLLELKLIADVGLVGFPNAGKSSILSAISGAKPKIAGYPFTTLSPNLGVLAVDDQQIIIADVPGLIEGAHDNKGLGHHFLRHVERTRLLVHVIDLSERDPLKDREVVLREFEAYGGSLLTRPCLVVGNKSDLPGTEDNGQALEREMERLGQRCLLTSAKNGEGIPELIREIVEMVRLHQRPSYDLPSGDLPSEALARGEVVTSLRLRGTVPLPVQVIRLTEGNGRSFRVEHANLAKTISRIDFDQEDALMKFARVLKRLKVEEALEKAGAMEGDKVYIGDVEFDFLPDRIVT